MHGAGDVAGNLPLLALKIGQWETAPCDQFFDGVFGQRNDAHKNDTADDRLRKLADWCNIHPTGETPALQAVDPNKQPSLQDFNVVESNPSRSAGNIVGAPNTNMAAIMIWCNWEISKTRYARYKALIAENFVELHRMQRLMQYDSALIDDLTKTVEGTAQNAPEWAQFDMSRRRRSALLDVRNEAMRRIMGIIKSAHTDSAGNYQSRKVLPFEIEDVINDSEDSNLVRELNEKDMDSNTSGTKKQDEIVIFNVQEQCAKLRAALLEIVDASGNERLKDFIYADIVAFMADGVKAVSVYRNYVFMGPSGVGKTTWAKLMGKCYQASGIYMYGSVTTTMANDYVGRYIGQSGPQTKAKLDSNLENIVLIDEAYQITESDGDNASYGAEVISTIVDYMDKNIGLLMIIVAGYEKNMKKSFLKANEGLDRRFPNKFVFPSYEASDMTKILQKKLRLPGGAKPLAPGGSAPFGEVSSLWAQEMFTQLEALIDLGIASQTELRRADNQKREEEENGSYLTKKSFSLLTNVSVPWAKEVAGWHSELFGKQGGSMENIAAKMTIYMAIPEKKPVHSRRQLYTYADDMTIILQSLLDYEKHKDDLSKPNSRLVQYLMSPVAKDINSNMFFDYNNQITNCPFNLQH